jgi:ergothioneine biosynthesis protein EgtB
MTSPATLPAAAPAPANHEPSAPSLAPAAEPQSLAARFRAVRQWSEHLCEPLVAEDYVVQSMPDVSPTKWHLAHTSWFFETFLLKAHANGYREFNPHFAYLFNSSYLTVGDRHCRQNRGLLSRPTVREVYDYRRHVDEHMGRWLAGIDASPAGAGDLLPLIELGLHHEQQHQELMLTDIKHVFWVNPLRPAYRPRKAPQGGEVPPMRWVDFPEGLRAVGHEGPAFAFDNEGPRHRVFLEPFRLAGRLVTNGEYKAFIDDGGYRRGDLWLSMGWATVQEEGWTAPLYWIQQDREWWHHTLAGLRPVEDDEPVCHVSHFEADAYARWAGARLPTEFEWEAAAERVAVEGNFADEEFYHPTPLRADDRGPALRQLFGDAWEWTRSQYSPYPGFQPAAGAIGEYNGKFMCNQFVLRGGSCATPAGHVRRTYRNFFPPDARWQFTGIRLAR